jgi:receptor expression-enhancing protein 5/6
MKLQKCLDQPLGTNPFIDVLIKIEKQTGIPRLYQVLPVILVCLAVFIIGYGSRFLANFIGFLYPAYASFKAVETPEKDDDTKWLTYWVVYACFSVFFDFSDIIIFWIPFYDLLKCCLFIWLMYPGESNGSITVYNRLILPYFLRHESQIDSTLTNLRKSATDSMGMVKELSDDLRDQTTKIASKITTEALTQAMREHEDPNKKE